MKKKIWKRIGYLVLFGFLMLNFVAWNHAYHFTHFGEALSEKTKRPEELSFGAKLHALFFGVNIPKPSNPREPKLPFETIYLQSHEQLETWFIPKKNHKGIVLLFHGFSAAKASQLAYANQFLKKGYATFLVDFMGSGGSTGNQTTIGFKEGRDVKVAFEYIKERFPEDEIILFGSSMGAASIMKSFTDYNIQPDKIILECPFADMLTTTRNRFNVMGIPSFPFAEILLFYGGMHSGFNAFKHAPSEYAKKISTPTLLLFGAKDDRVNQWEIDTIFENLAGEKKLVIFEASAHEIYLNDNKDEWNEEIDIFLE